MPFSSSFRDDVRQRTSLAEIVSGFVAWDRKKSRQAEGDFWACCPFHVEKTPSFHVDDRRGRYHCFGCGVSGDVFSFLIEKEGLSFREALDRLAARAGLSSPAISRGRDAPEPSYAGLFRTLEAAASYFQSQLAGRSGSAARRYLEARGLTASSIRDFRIGYAPESPSSLRRQLSHEGIAVQDMVGAGLLCSGTNFSDRFRDRVMFPICDSRGRVIGFGGRALTSSVSAKYINTPETPLFRKGESLYHAPSTGTAAMGAVVRRAETVVVVEGYTDVIALDQIGIKHVVAPLGTALTQCQLALLWRMSDEPTLCFDGDSAGFRAACRVVDRALPLLAPGKSLRFVLLPEGCDPDDIIRYEGQEGMERALASALPLVDMLWKRECDGGDWSTPERQAAFRQRVKMITKAIKDDDVRALYAIELRRRMHHAWTRQPGYRQHMKKDFFLQKRGLPSRRERMDGVVRRVSPVRAFPAREALLLATVLNHPSVLFAQVEALSALELAHPGLDRLRHALLDLAAEGGEEEGRMESASDIADGLAVRGLGELADRVKRMVQRDRVRFALPDSHPRDAERGFEHTLALHRKFFILNRELQTARQAFERDGTSESFSRLIGLKEEMAGVEGTEVALDVSSSPNLLLEGQFPGTRTVQNPDQEGSDEPGEDQSWK